MFQALSGFFGMEIYSGLTLNFFCPRSGINRFSKGPCYLLVEIGFLKAKTWELGTLTAAGVLLLLGHVSG